MVLLALGIEVAAGGENLAVDKWNCLGRARGTFLLKMLEQVQVSLVKRGRNAMLATTLIE